MMHIIANMMAGNGRAKKALERVEEYLKKKRTAFEVHISQYPGHSIELAHNLSQLAEPVVALGGDGTVAEVAQGLMGGNAVMGIIPAGSGNDYRRSHGIPGNVLKAVDVILKGNTRRVDTMEVNGRVFINIINVGLDNEVAEQAYRFKRFGKLAYLLSALYVIRYYKSRNMRITFNDEVIERKLLLMCAGCGTHYGGGMNALPTANPCDGYLDICVVDDVKPWIVLCILPLYMMGRHTRIHYAHFYRAKEVSIECLDEVIPIGGDGEVVQNATPAKVVVKPGALSLFV